MTRQEQITRHSVAAVGLSLERLTAPMAIRAAIQKLPRAMTHQTWWVLAGLQFRWMYTEIRDLKPTSKESP